MSNAAIAHHCARQMAAMTKKVWISDNLPILSRKERKEILAIYKQYFKVVEYDAGTGICKCWVSTPEPSDNDTFAQFDSFNVPTKAAGSTIKSSTLNAIGATSANTVHIGTVITNI